MTNEPRGASHKTAGTHEESDDDRDHEEIFIAARHCWQDATTVVDQILKKNSCAVESGTTIRADA
jgi:hypothetical protein